MFGRAFSGPVQKLAADPGMAVVPREALSKGSPRNEKKSPTQLVGGNAQLVCGKTIAFSCSEPGNFRLSLQGHKLFQGARSLYPPMIEAIARWSIVSSGSMII
jgi:hypothetical protein